MEERKEEKNDVQKKEGRKKGRKRSRNGRKERCDEGQKKERKNEKTDRGRSCRSSCYLIQSSILAPSHPVLVLDAYGQTSDRVASGVPILSHWSDTPEDHRG